MGKLEERSDGYYVLQDVKVGIVNVQPMVFQKVEKPLEDVSEVPKSDGFYLDIPDRM